jgi:site-specific DNA-cytosine methylase
MDKQKPITVVSLFSGCGGMDLGFSGGFEFLGKKYKKTNEAVPKLQFWNSNLRCNRKTGA